MICDPCRKGGKWNKQANTPGGIEAEYCHAAAKKEHARCEAPTTCPCQHYIGQVTKQGGSA